MHWLIGNGLVAIFTIKHKLYSIIIKNGFGAFSDADCMSSFCFLLIPPPHLNTSVQFLFAAKCIEWWKWNRKIHANLILVHLIRKCVFFPAPNERWFNRNFQEFYFCFLSFDDLFILTGDMPRNQRQTGRRLLCLLLSFCFFPSSVSLFVIANAF